MAGLLLAFAFFCLLAYLVVDGIETRIDKRFLDLRRDLVDAGVLPESALKLAPYSDSQKKKNRNQDGDA